MGADVVSPVPLLLTLPGGGIADAGDCPALLEGGGVVLPPSVGLVARAKGGPVEADGEELPAACWLLPEEAVGAPPVWAAGACGPGDVVYTGGDPAPFDTGAGATEDATTDVGAIDRGAVAGRFDLERSV